MKASRYLFLSLFYCFLTSTFAQNRQGEATHRIVRSDGSIKIDGILDEATWEKAQRSGGFYQTFPTDNQLAQDSTQFMMAYDDQYIYVGIICYDYLPGKPITNTLKRDFSWMRNDNISVYIDPYNDKSNGFTFQVTYDNVQREGLVVLGGSVQEDWDNKWYSEVTKGENMWYAEMAIPFKSIRYNSVANWNVQLIRNNQKRNERSTWIQVPQQFRASDMTYSGKLAWDTPPPEAGTNMAFIPYVSGRVEKNHEEGSATSTKADAGFDAKIGLSNSVNLDLTFNPDFSQVEVDQQVTNLQRFEISFPERRQFFLENQDLFAENGFRSSRPFFSRRIGIQGSGSTQRNVPIIGGARVSGKIGSKWRIGVLNMITNKDETSEEISPAQNYAVAVLERQLFQRSRISAVFVGRNNLGEAALDSFNVVNNEVRDAFGTKVDPNDTLLTLSKYNYVYGLDYNLATVNNRWEGNFYYHRSVDPDQKEDVGSAGAFLRYQTTKVNIRSFTRFTGEGYNAEVGFVPRVGVFVTGGRININYFSDGIVQRHGPNIGGDIWFDRNWDKLDNSISGGYEVQFLSSSRLEYGFRYQSVKLTRAFDPSRTDGQKLPEGSELEWVNMRLFYQSNNRKNFNYNMELNHGGFYNGKRTRISAEALYRIQPIARFGVTAEFNQIDLPIPYKSTDLLLLGPKIDLTLTNKVFLTSFVQYNTQDQNLGHNFRFQWRFKPVSDLFVVYTDNYFTENFSTRNRALVVKLNYWLNL